MTDLEAGWQALSRGKWDEALEYFNRDEDDPGALEGIGVAQWWLDDADATLAARERAYRLFPPAATGSEPRASRPVSRGTRFCSAAGRRSRAAGLNVPHACSPTSPCALSTRGSRSAKRKSR